MALNGASVGAGLPLTKTLSVEGSVGWYEALSRNSSFNTPFGRRDIRTTDRNVPLAGSLRWSMACARQVCADLIGGGGVNFRQLTIRTLATCPPPGAFGPCVESDHVEETNEAEFLLTGGVARTVLLRAGDRSSDIPNVLMSVNAFYRFR